MVFTVTTREVCIIIIVISILIFIYKIFKKLIFPWLMNKKTKEIEVNPKWIMDKLQTKYYGFHDMDIIIVNSPLGVMPRFRLAKGSKTRLQLLIPEDTTTKDIEDVAHLALAGKLKIKYGVWYPNKSSQWLSILNYMLDGKDIKTEATKWEEALKSKE